MNNFTDLVSVAMARQLILVIFIAIMAIAILHQVSIRKTQAMEDLIFPMLLFTLVMTLERVGQWEQK